MVTSKENFEWKKYLEECMQSTEFCCLATVDDNGVWSNTIYFAWDDNLNLYFISQPQSHHMKNLVKDPRIAISIYNTTQSTFDDVAGIQLDGEAHILTEKTEVNGAYAIYYGRKYPDTSRNPRKEEDAYINNPEWQFVKIVPKHIYYFDTRFFDEERQEVPREIYSE
ncbi:MAG: pyridoxamine 5'-phosphate oxidase family protein [Patescibacteria group bacterium]|nr:pyridoxamine 5'-phosphate oxidase family protein [Patescibacteria group bacterium]